MQKQEPTTRSGFLYFCAPGSTIHLEKKHLLDQHGTSRALPTMMLLGLTFPAAQSWSALAGRKPGSWKWKKMTILKNKIAKTRCKGTQRSGYLGLLHATAKYRKITAKCSFHPLQILQEMCMSFICKKKTHLTCSSNLSWCRHQMLIRLPCLANGPQSSLKSMEPQLDHSWPQI